MKVIYFSPSHVRPRQLIPTAWMILNYVSGLQPEGLRLLEGEIGEQPNKKAP